jgi:hypothetical protein
MDVLASALLLAAFVLFVDLTFGEGSHVAAQLGGLFSSDATLGWPAGIQEDDHPWLVLHRASALTTATDGWTPPTRSLPAQVPGVTESAPALDGPSGAWPMSTIEDTDEPVRTQRVEGGLITGPISGSARPPRERVIIGPAIGRVI